MTATTGVLLLNATFEPLRIVSLHRAVCMIVEDKAEVVDAVEGQEIRSQFLSLPWPSVVRLKRYVKVRFRKFAPLSSRAVLSRDRHECAYCEDRATTMDHIIPRARGGTHEWSNVVAACVRCNAKKSDQTLEELGWVLRFSPTIPPSHHWLVIGWAERQQWEPYIARLG